MIGVGPKPLTCRVRMLGHDELLELLRLPGAIGLKQPTELRLVRIRATKPAGPPSRIAETSALAHRRPRLDVGGTGHEISKRPIGRAHLELFFDHQTIALQRSLLPDRTILTGRQRLGRADGQTFDRDPGTLENLEPGPAAEQTEPDRNQAQQDHRRSNRAQHQAQAIRDQIPRHAPRRQGHRQTQGVQSLRFETDATREQHRKSEPAIPGESSRIRIR